MPVIMVHAIKLPRVIDKAIEQRVCLKFCVSNGIAATESLKMLQKCFGESTLSRTQVFEWHNRFSEGRRKLASCKSSIHLC